MIKIHNLLPGFGNETKKQTNKQTKESPSTKIGMNNTFTALCLIYSSKSYRIDRFRQKNINCFRNTFMRVDFLPDIPYEAIWSGIS